MHKKNWPIWLGLCIASTSATASINLPTIAVESSWQDTLTTPEHHLKDEQLFTQTHNTLGGTLAKTPGVHNDSYGLGAGRPIIRGQGSPRVAVLRNGTRIMDASSLSPDHANAVEPLLAQGLEVIRGPATLLYSSGASGGVVNVRSPHIATQRPSNGYAGSAAILGSSVNNAHEGAFQLTGEINKYWLFHGAASVGRSNDYKAPQQPQHRVPDTFTEKNLGTVGISWVGERGYLGMAVTEHNSTYGLPAHSHEYEHCHPHDGRLYCHEGHHHDEHDDHSASLKLNSRRVNVEGEYRPFASAWRAIRLAVSYTNYQHDEREDAAVATQFSHQGGQFRVEAEHAPWRSWQGIIGIEYNQETASSAGLERFMPKVNTDSIALFALETVPLHEAVSWQTSARYEHQWLSAKHEQQRQQGAVGMATGLNWHLSEALQSGLNLSYGQRLPNAQELYANGPHLATNTYECGLLSDGCAQQTGANKEITYGAEVYLAKERGQWQFNLSTYYQRIHDYVHSHVIDTHEGFRLVQYQQADAEFVGLEADSTWMVHPQWAVSVFTDHVLAKYVEAGRLPRIPAQRYGLRVLSFHTWVDTEWELTRVHKQRRIGQGESATPGHTELAVTLNHYLQGDERYHVFVRGSNLLNQRQWQHASFLAHRVPEPGRNITAGIKVQF